MTDGKTRALDWANDKFEDELGFLRRRLLVDRKEFAITSETCLGVGFHALGRRYERGRNRSDEAVIRDLLAGFLAMGGPPIDPDDMRLPCPSGEWRGLVASTKENGEDPRLIPKIRTFASSDMQWF
jgi:hypothetical protein